MMNTCKPHEDPAVNAGLRMLAKERRWHITLVVTVLLLVLYAFGVIFILNHSLFLSIIGIGFIAQALILSWYLSHECAHLLAFKGRRPNLLLGDFLSWFNGTAHFSFNEYRKDHLRHHAEQVDLVGVDLTKLLRSTPVLLRYVILGVEWLYIPSVYLCVKLSVVSAGVGMRNRAGRRVWLTALSYIAFFMILGVISWKALVCYIIAVTIRVHCVRFVDAFQHTFTHVDVHTPSPARGRVYEQQHTFSFPVARRLRFLNLFILNFGFHNAHHAIPGCPWYNLEKLDRLLSTPEKVLVGTLRSVYARHDVSTIELIRAYHRYRLHRIVCGNSGSARKHDMEFSMAHFSGAFTDNLLG